MLSKEPNMFAVKLVEGNVVNSLPFLQGEQVNQIKPIFLLHLQGLIADLHFSGSEFNSRQRPATRGNK